MVLRTRNERSGDILMTDMRSGESAFLGRDGVRAGTSIGDRALIWLLDEPDEMRLAELGVSGG